VKNVLSKDQVSHLGCIQLVSITISGAGKVKEMGLIIKNEDFYLSRQLLICD
jgi:hypothetical protein